MDMLQLEITHLCWNKERLLGPNGAGKSTTFNIMTAAIPKTSGSIKLQGT